MLRHTLAHIPLPNILAKDIQVHTDSRTEIQVCKGAKLTDIHTHRCTSTYRPIHKYPEMHKMYTHLNNTQIHTDTQIVHIYK